ncbi:MAG: ABC transporter permease [Anaerolineales bacterium]
MRASKRQLVGRPDSQLDVSGDKARRSPLHDAWRSFRRNRVALISMVYLGLVAIVAIAAPWITPYGPKEAHVASRNMQLASRFEPGDFQLARCHWLGTALEEVGCRTFLLGSNANGSDMWSLTAYGARTSMAVALVASATSLIIGISYGTLAGYVGGQADEVMMRFVDFLYALPVFIVVLGIQSFFRFAYLGDEGFMRVLADWNDQLGGLLFLFIAIGAVNWVAMARMARAMVHASKRAEHVEAARAIGASDSRILGRHILPNIVGPLIIVETLAIPGYIFLEATLSFLGLGVGSAGTSWGAMINNGYAAIRSAPRIILIPSIALSLLTLAFNFVGDGLRDAADPRLQGR